MASYAILNSIQLEDGRTSYDVILKADDGYQEAQTYVGDEQVLADAAKHMNEEHMAQAVKPELVIDASTAEPITPVFVEV